ncbi:MAG: hypothetical protein EOM31_07820 [Bacteroidia bacterium]|nr:hypothetical protein [Bacteroidia bacterium]
MIKADKKSGRTDLAWKKLYHRLESDGLMEEPSAKQTPMGVYRLAIRWSVAAVVVLAIGMGVYKWTLSDSASTAVALITRSNSESYRLVESLQDGSVVYLAHASSLQYPETFATDKREVNLQGEAYFDVAKKSQCPFYIQTEDVQIKVLGTAFNVKSDEQCPFKLEVERGLVRVSLRQGTQHLYVKAGETATLFNRRLYLSPSEDAGIFDRYRKHIRFKDEPLTDILRIINMNASGTTIQLATPELGQRRVTVAFSDIDPESVVVLISAALNLTYERQANEWVLHE